MSWRFWSVEILKWEKGHFSLYSDEVFNRKFKNIRSIYVTHHHDLFIWLGKFQKINLICFSFGGMFRYSAGQNDTSPKYFWSLCCETRSCRWGLRDASSTGFFRSIHFGRPFSPILCYEKCVGGKSLPIWWKNVSN